MPSIHNYIHTIYSFSLHNCTLDVGITTSISQVRKLSYLYPSNLHKFEQPVNTADRTQIQTGQSALQH